MSTYEIADGIYWVGVKDRELEIFDVILKTQHGTTYNSYLVKGEKNVLIDTVKAKYSDKFISNISAIIPPEEIDTVIVNHSEPDHSGSLSVILEYNKDVEIICTKQAEMFLKEQLNKELNCTIIKGNEMYDAGNGFNFRFIKVPFVHWPDTMFTYLENKNVLFSCDCFGSHYCPSNDMLAVESAELAEAREYYFNYILRPFRKKLRMAFDEVINLKIEYLLPSHGPFYNNTADVFEMYRQWTKLPQKNEDTKTVLIIYVTAHGNTAYMADKLKEYFSANNVNAEVFDFQRTDFELLRNKIEVSDGVLFGSPTLVNDAPGPIWDAVYLLSTVKHSIKQVGVFGSYGWSGEAVGRLMARLKDMRLNVLEEGLKFKFAPSENDLKLAEEFCKKFTDNL